MPNQPHPNRVRVPVRLFTPDRELVQRAAARTGETVQAFSERVLVREARAVLEPEREPEPEPAEPQSSSSHE